jgi:integrase
MREGEVCGLKWKCYDEQSGTIRVEKAVAKAGGKKYVTDPKTEASKRDIPVHFEGIDA